MLSSADQLSRRNALVLKGNAGKFPENPFFPKDFFPEKSSRIFPIFFSWKFFFPKKEIPKFLIPEKNFSRKPFPEN